MDDLSTYCIADGMDKICYRVFTPGKAIGNNIHSSRIQNITEETRSEDSFPRVMLCLQTDTQITVLQIYASR